MFLSLGRLLLIFLSLGSPVAGVVAVAGEAVAGNTVADDVVAG